MARLNALGFRIVGAASANQINGGIPAYSLPAASNGGFYMAPIVIPRNWDGSRASYIYLTFMLNSANSSVETYVLFENRIDWHNPPDDTNFYAQDEAVIIPPDTPAQTFFTFQMQNALDPTQPTFFPGWLQPNAIIAARCTRLGPNTGDTFPGSISLIALMQIDYFCRCQTPCC